MRKTLESNQIPEGTSRLAGGPYRHQGLSSVVFTTGYDPITSDVSDRRSTNWATWTCCGLDRDRTYDLRVNSSLLYLWATSPFGGRGGTRTPSLKWERFYRPRGYQLPVTLPFCTPYRDRTCDLLYVKQPLLPAELRVCKDNTFF